MVPSAFLKSWSVHWMPVSTTATITPAPFVNVVLAWSEPIWADEVLISFSTR